MIRWFVTALLGIVTAASGCAGGHGNSVNGDVPRPAGFAPPPPEPGEVEYDSPIISAIAPGTDVTYCSYLDKTVATDTDIVHFRAFQSLSGHHAVLFTARQPRPVDTHICTEDDMTNTHSYIAGGGGESIGTITIPDGLAFRIPAGTQLMMQTHWINASQEVRDGQVVVYVTAQPADSSRQVLDLFNVIKADFMIPAGQRVTGSTSCVLKQDVQLLTLTGHEHEFGSHVDIQLGDGANTTMLWSYDWQPSYQSAPPYTIYSVDQPLKLKAGQTLQVTCSWMNSTANDIAFPREMCIGTGFYYPAVGEIDCTDGIWGM